MAFLHGDIPHSELVFPTWFALEEGRQGRWRTLLPPTLRWARPTWAGDGSCLVLTAVQGIRQGIVTVDPATGRWQWCAPETAASYRSPTMTAGGGEVVAIRQPLDGQPAIVAARGRHRRVLQPLGEPATARHRWRVHGWQGHDGTLEGVLGTPATGSEPWALVVDLHAGPRGGLVAGDPDHRTHLGHLVRPRVRHLRPRLPRQRHPRTPRHARGPPRRRAARRRPRGPGCPQRGRLPGSYRAGRPRAAVHVRPQLRRLPPEPHPDHRAPLRCRGLLGGRGRPAPAGCAPGRSAAQRAWRGGSPLEVPEQWAAASPAIRADRVRTPLLLVYGQESMGPTHGVAWFTALRDRGVPCELVLYEGEGHLFSRPENKADMFVRAVAWFRQHQTGSPTARSTGGTTRKP